MIDENKHRSVVRVHLGHRSSDDIGFGLHAFLGDCRPDHLIGELAVVVKEFTGQMGFGIGQTLIEIVRGVGQHRLGAFLGGGEHLLLRGVVSQLVGPEQE